MADRRIKDIAVERIAPLSDDFFVMDGVSGGSARISGVVLLQQDIGIPIIIRENPITTGIKGNLEVPCNCDVTGWTVLADQTGSIVVDIWRSTFAAYPPVVGNSITGTEKPTLSSAIKNQDLALSTWAITLNKGDILRYNVDSVSAVTNVTINIRAKRRP